MKKFLEYAIPTLFIELILVGFFCILFGATVGVAVCSAVVMAAIHGWTAYCNPEEFND